MEIRAPIRSSTCRKPVRVGLIADAVEAHLGAGEERRRGEEGRRRGEVARNVERQRGKPVGRPDAHGAGPSRDARPGRGDASARCGRGSAPARRRSSGRSRRRGPRGGRTTSPARSRPGARSGSAASASALERAGARARRSSSTVAPISRSGSATRSSGRRESDSSPTSSKRPSCPASIPGSSRIRVPALPQSIGTAGRAKAAEADAARPAGRRPSSSTVAPSAATAAAVESVSSERPKPRISLSPSAIAASSSARWEMDLSPGTARSPRRLTAGSSRTGLSRPRRTPARRSPSTPGPRAAGLLAWPPARRRRGSRASRPARATCDGRRSPRC